MAILLQKLKPEAEKEPTVRALPVVEVAAVKQETLKLELPSQGMVEPARETQVASEVAGKVVWVSDKFEAGGQFAKGEAMIRLETADYESALAQAKSSKAQAELVLATEEAQAEKALRDWQRLGRGGKPTDLTLRKPQIASAKAQIDAARANVEKAQRDLARTEIKADYDSRLEAISVELGSYLAPGDPVANVYAVAPFEIRLPLSLDEFALIGTNPNAVLKTKAGGQSFEWKGKVVRQEGVIDRASRSVFLVAEVSPRPSDIAIMQPGLFVQAEVEGRTIRNAVRVPLKAFYGEDRLVLVGPDNRLKFRTVTVLRRQGDEAIVTAGLDQGERICLTPIEAVIEGMEVKIREIEAEEDVDEPIELTDTPS